MQSIAVKTFSAFAVFAGNANAAVMLAASPAALRPQPMMPWNPKEQPIYVNAITAQLGTANSPSSYTVRRAEEDFSEIPELNPEYQNLNKIMMDQLIQQKTQQFERDLTNFDTTKNLTYGSTVSMLFEDGSYALATWNYGNAGRKFRGHRDYWTYQYDNASSGQHMMPMRVRQMPPNWSEQLIAIPGFRSSLRLVVNRIIKLKKLSDGQ